VSAVYEHPKFAVPDSCAAIHTQVVKNDGRGFVTLPVEPTVGNGLRGEVEIFDDPAGPGVYDITVTLSCVGTATPPTVRLGCAHSVGTGSCHQGRIEVKDPETSAWGTVCGHYFWNDDKGADIVCRSLGYIGGTVFTFGASVSLPALPVVSGFRVCEGNEAHVTDCPLPTNWAGHPDSIGNGVDATCSHGIDQGAICYDDARPSQIKLEACSGFAAQGGNGVMIVGNHEGAMQPIFFGCIEFYSTQCSYDISNMAGSGAQGGAFPTKIPKIDNIYSFILLVHRRFQSGDA
jgi:hypothetical protein